MTAPARFPIEPLLDYVERRFGPLAKPNAGTKAPGELSNTDLAVILGTSSELVGRWRRRGYLTELTAERIALDLVGHPAILWPAEYAELAAA